MIITKGVSLVMAQAADWVGTLGGAHTGVYLLYGHPTCDWEWTLKNLQNRQRFAGCSISSFKNK
eukprot:1335756-Prorocentrum_lima.AAC.1